VLLSAALHGAYNALTIFMPAALAIKIVGLAIAVRLYRSLVELSPYRVYSLSMARTAIRQLHRGLFFNPRSPLLNRNIGLYLMHVGDYQSAAKHFRASVPRSRDARRARFLAACCEQTFIPRVHATRVLRAAWSRLGDEQRTAFLRQLRELVGERDGIYERVRTFTETSFRPRRMKSTREIAREQKVRRIERRSRTTTSRVSEEIDRLTPAERARIARSLRRDDT
jgi:hypothetical protein